MTHVFSYHGSLTQFWEVLRSEYHRQKAILGCPPFTLDMPNPKITDIDSHTPKDGDEIILYFQNKENNKDTVLVVEASLLPDEDKKVVNIVVIPQYSNSFEEPLKSVMSIWKEIKKALKKAEKRHVIKVSKRKKRGGPHESTLFALDSLRKIYSQASKNRLAILTRKDAAEKAGIAINTWRKHDQKLWNHWEDDGY